MTRVAGVDGCRTGWIVVVAESGTRLSPEKCVVLGNFGNVLDVTRGCACVAVDIPIGLTEGSSRDADKEARQRLGQPRASSVFPAPPRPLLGEFSYAQACAMSARISGKKISRQTYGLLRKIREVDEAMKPALQTRIVETHPELGFWALEGGRALVDSKRTDRGKRERRRLLMRVYTASFARLSPPPGSRSDDLHDACVAAWTASRYVQGQAGRVPQNPPKDARGLRMEIVF